MSLYKDSGNDDSEGIAILVSFDNMGMRLIVANEVDSCK